MSVVLLMTEINESSPPITLIDPIDMSKLDPKFRDEIKSMPNGEALSACFACSTCTAACPIANMWKYKPHQLIRMILLGMKEEVLSSDILWMCSRCYTCYALCPQDVKFSDVVGILRDMSIKEGCVPVERHDKAKELDTQIQKLRCMIIEHKLNPDKKQGGAIKKMVDEILTETW